MGRKITPEEIGGMLNAIDDWKNQLKKKNYTGKPEQYKKRQAEIKEHIAKLKEQIEKGYWE